MTRASKRILNPLLMAWVATTAACSVVAGYPDVKEEDCQDGIDNDLSGEADCADPSCAAACASPPPASPQINCFAQGTLLFAPELDESGVVQACNPWPLEGPDCGEGEVALPGEPICLESLGNPEAPLDATYVEPGRTGGDGSRANPFGSLAEALDAGATVVALAPGTYPGGLVLDRAVALWNEGLTSPVISGGRGGEAAIRITAPGVHLSGLTIRHEEGPGIVVEAGADDTRISSTIIEGVQDIALEVQGGGVAVDRLVIRDVTGEETVGVRVATGASAALRAARIEAVSTGVAVDGGSLTSGGLAILGTSTVGVEIADGSQVELNGAVLEADGGVTVRTNAGANGQVRIGRSLLDGNRAAAGLSVLSGRVTVEESFVRRSLSEGITVEAGILEANDLVLANTLGPGTEQARGLYMAAGTSLMGSRLLLQANGGHALVLEETPNVAISDLAILGEQAVSSPATGITLIRAAAILMRFLINRPGRCGLRIVGSEVRLVASEGAIEEADSGICLNGVGDLPLEPLTQIRFSGNEQWVLEERRTE